MKKFLKMKNFPKAKVNRINNDHKEKNKGHLSDRTKWSEDFKLYNTQKVKAHRAVVHLKRLLFQVLYLNLEVGKESHLKIQNK